MACAALMGCKKDEPCGPHGKVDTRPLPDAWAKYWATPPGTTGCTIGEDSYGDVQRNYSVPADSTPKAVEAWASALTAKGWKKQPPTKEDLDAAMTDKCMHGDSYLHDDGYYLGVSVSSCAEGRPGWSTVVFRPKTDAER